MQFANQTPSFTNINSDDLQQKNNNQKDFNSNSYKPTKIVFKKYVLKIGLFLFLFSIVGISSYLSVKMNFDDRSDASEGVFQASPMTASTQLFDNRLAISGDREIVKNLGFKWSYNWGNSSTTYPNKDEVDANKLYGIKNFFTVGKLDPGLKEPTDAELIGFENTYLADQKERLEYGKMVANLPTSLSASIIKKVKTSYLLIPKNASENVTHYWSIANEPDLFPYINPDTYANHYKYFSDRILKYDKNAKISFGGLFRPKYPYNYLQSHLNENLNALHYQGFKYILASSFFNNLLNSAPNEAQRQLIKDNAYLHFFREFYKSQYVEYPRIDYINIHSYNSDFIVPFNNPTINDYVQFAISGVDNVKAYANVFGMQNLPIFVTEVSLLPGGCGPVYNPTTKIPSNNHPYFDACNQIFNNPTSAGYDNKVYMNNYIRNMITNKKAQKIFWFTAVKNTYTWGFLGTNYKAVPSAVYYKDGTSELNEAGKEFVKIATELADFIPPSIEKISQLNTGYNVAVTINAKDDGANSSGPMEYWYSVSSSPVSSIDSGSDLQDWKFSLNISNEQKILVPRNFQRNYLNIAVADASGNFTYKNVILGDFSGTDLINSVGTGDFGGWSVWVMPGGEIRQALIRGGKYYQRVKPVGGSWSILEESPEATTLINSVGTGDFGGWSVWVMPGGEIRQALIRGGKYYQRVKPVGGSWSILEESPEATTLINSVGTGDFGGWSVLILPEGEIRQDLIRGGKYYQRLKLGNGDWSTF